MSDVCKGLKYRDTSGSSVSKYRDICRALNQSEFSAASITAKETTAHPQLTIRLNVGRHIKFVAETMAEYSRVVSCMSMKEQD